MSNSVFKVLCFILAACTTLYAGENKRNEVETAPVTVTSVRDVGKIEIGLEDIQRNNPDNLVELFRENPAVNITGGGAANNKIFIHGIDQSNINVTVDGASVGAYGWHHASNSNIDVNFLKAVTIDVGVAPADSGFGSVAGAVRFATKDAVDMLRKGEKFGLTTTASYSFENKGLRETTAMYGMYSNFDALLMYTYNNSNDWKNGKNEIQKGTREDLDRFLFKLGHTTNEGGRLVLSAEYSEDSAKRMFKANMKDARYESTQSLIVANQKRTTVSLKYTTLNPSRLYDPEVEFYVNDMRQKWGSTGDMYILKIGGRAQNKISNDYGSINSGVEFHNLDIEAKHKPGVLEKSFVGGLYSQARILPVDMLALSFGIRNDFQSFDSVDKQRYSNNGLSYNFSAEVSPQDWFSVFVDANHVWGGINSVEHALLDKNVKYKNVKPVTADNYIAGFRLHNDYLDFETSYYSTLIRNPMSYDNGNKRKKILGSRKSGENILSKGVDVKLNARYNGFKAGAAYTYNDIKYGSKKASPSNFYIASPAGQLFTAYAEYKFKPIQLTVGASNEYAAKIDEKPDYYVHNYNVTNAHVSWDPEFMNRLFSIRMDVKNMFDENYYSRATFAGSQTKPLIQPVYEQGRTFVLTSTLRF